METSPDSDPVLNAHDNVRDNAREIHSYLDKIASKDRLFEHPYLNALYNDATGLLVAISQGTVTVSQPRIADQLLKIVENYPSNKDPSHVVAAIANCGEFGISAEGYDFSRNIGRGSSTISR